MDTKTVSFGGSVNVVQRFTNAVHPIKDYFETTSVLNKCEIEPISFDGSFSLQPITIKHLGGTQQLYPELLCPDKNKYDTSFCNPKTIKYHNSYMNNGVAPTIDYQYCFGPCT